MLLYYLYKLYYLLIVKVDTVIPEVDFSLPDYHDRWESIIHGIGFFIDLTAIGQLMTILIAYQGIRLAVAFIRFYRNR